MHTVSEEDYDKLCVSCDALLNKRPSSVTRNVNAFLHVIREHPIFLTSFQAVFEKNKAKFYFQIVKQLTINIIVGSLKLCHSLYRNYLKNDKIVYKNTKADYLFVSHFLNKDFLTHKKDFYFFDLPNEIQEKKEESLLLYINFTGLSVGDIQKEWSKRSPQSLVLPRYLPFWQEIEARFLFIKEAISLLSEKTDTPFEKRVKLWSAVGALSSTTFSNFRIAVLVKTILERNPPKYIFTTYEGHPWERTIYFLAREVNKEIKCVGYQHALIFRKQHAIKRKLSAAFEPNFILCSGRHAKSQFSNTDYLSEERLLLFGSNRTKGTKRLRLAVNERIKNTFLMLSEGDLVECIPLTRLVIKMAKKYPQLNFIIRFHPITKVNKVMKLCPELKNPSKNMIISKQTLEADLERAHYALYRGSTTIIKAIQYGLIPLYFEQENQIPIDPLYEKQSVKVNVNKSGDLETLMDLNEETLKKNQLDLIKYVDQFFSPIDYTVVEQLKSKS